MIIQDGSGRGYTAKVDKENRLSVEVSSGAGPAAQTSRAWAMNNSATDATITVTATGGTHFHIVNSSSAGTAIVIENVTVSTNTAGVLYKSAIGSAGDTGNSTAVKGYPLNTASSVQPSTSEMMIWDEVADGMTGLSGGSTVTTVVLAAGTTVLDAGGMVVLSPGGSFSGGFKGASECSFNIRFYEISL